MRQIIIFGITDFARELTYYLETDSGDQVVAYTLNKEYIKEETFNGRKLIPYEDLHQFYSKDDVEILITIGYRQMNDIRKNIFQMCKKDNWKIASFIHSSVRNMSIRMGEGNIILENVDLRYESEIGDGNILLTGTCISHNTKIGNFNYFVGGHIGGYSVAGNNNFVGIRSIIQNNVNIGDYNVIDAGVCLSKTIDNTNLVQASNIKIKKLDKDIITTIFDI